MKLKYAVNRGEERHSLIIEGAEPSIISQIVGLMTLSPSPEKIIRAETNIEMPIKGEYPLGFSPIKQVEQPPIPVETPVKTTLHLSDPSKKNIVHEEFTGWVSLADKLREAGYGSEKNETISYDIPKNSIREVDSEGGKLPLYLTKIDCPSCGSKHTRFSGENNKYIKCRDCSQPLSVERAMPNHLQPDSHGHLFIATRVYQ